MQVKRSNRMNPGRSEVFELAGERVCSEWIGSTDGTEFIMGQIQFWSMRYEAEEKILASVERDFLNGK
jgi:hypothetical protein